LCLELKQYCQIDRIEYIHSQHVIHCDLKPDNILIGLGKSKNTIHLIDFGLAKHYRNPFTNLHVEMRENQSPVGTTRFSSINAQSGRTLSRRDDLESLAYILIYFLRSGLPWQDIDTRPKKNKKTILSMKQVPADVLCQGLPVEFQDFLEHVRELEFKQRPDYDFYRRLFLYLLANPKTISSGPAVFDWELPTVVMSVTNDSDTSDEMVAKNPRMRWQDREFK
jgi:serine/threonine protein kinase